MIKCEWTVYCNLQSIPVFSDLKSIFTYGSEFVNTNSFYTCIKQRDIFDMNIELYLSILLEIVIHSFHLLHHCQTMITSLFDWFSWRYRLCVANSQNGLNLISDIMMHFKLTFVTYQELNKDIIVRKNTPLAHLNYQW